MEQRPNACDRENEAMTDVHNLHDRATRGELLSEEDQVQLDAWYEQMDAQELAQLNSNIASPADRQLIQEQINATIARIQNVTTKIQTTLDENERLRRENLSLTARLAQTSASRAA